MSRRVALAALAVALVAGGCARSAQAPDPNPSEALPPIGTVDCPDDSALAPAGRVAGGDDRLPDVTLECLGSARRVPLARLRGPAVVNLWASWCHPCRAEMPAFERVAKATKGNVLFLGVNTRDFERPARRTIQDTGIGYASVQDPKEQVRKALDAIGMPVTVLVDRDGRIVLKQVGEMTEADLRAALRKHFGVAA